MEDIGIKFYTHSSNNTLSELSSKNDRYPTTMFQRNCEY